MGKLFPERRKEIINETLEKLMDLKIQTSKEHGFNFNKGEFQDSLNLRYDKPLKNLPSKCPCTSPFTITHAMNCHRGGFINIRHNNIRDYEVGILKKFCKYVQVEPPLQPTLMDSNSTNPPTPALMLDQM